MSNVLIEEQYLSDIADAIRSKNGSNQAYYPSEMAQAIIDIPSGGTPTQYNVLCFTAEEPNSTVYIQCNTSLDIHLQYSYDNQNWNNWSSSVSEDGQDVFSTISLTNAGDKVYVRGNNATMGTSMSIYSRFYMSGKISASGNIQSLLTYDCSYLSVRDYCYYSIFQNCTSLTTAPELPATTLAPVCYGTMFLGCTNLSEAPELPVTTLASNCYYRMFCNCTSLVEAPELPATTLAEECYYEMFKDCTSLTTAPELPATTLAPNCYGMMFFGCTNLSEAPELPATTLAANCYYGMFCNCTSLVEAPELPVTTLAPACYRDMFSGCTSLAEAPELPATTLAANCYYGMFSICTSLTTAPELPATTLAPNCYYGMFWGSTSLTYIKVYANSWATDYAPNWVYNVKANGTFSKPSGTSITTGIDGIPTGWTVENF